MFLQEWLKKTFAINDAVAASILVTITVFVVGGILKWVSNLFLNYKLRANNRRLFFNCLNKLPKKFNQQCQELQTTVNRLILDGKEDFYYNQLNYPEIETILQIPYRDLFLANFSGFENIFKNLIQKRKRDAAFDEIRDILTKSLFYDKKSADDMETFLKSFNMYVSEITDLLIKFQLLIETHRRNTLMKNENPGLKVLMTELDKVYTTWQQGEIFSSLVGLEENLLLPIKEVCDKYPTTDVYLEIIPKLFQLQIVYRNIVGLVNNRKKQFLEYKRIFHINEERLPLVISILNKNYMLKKTTI